MSRLTNKLANARAIFSLSKAAAPVPVPARSGMSAPLRAMVTLSACLGILPGLRGDFSDAVRYRSSFFLDQLKTPKWQLRFKAESRFVGGLDDMRLWQVNQRLGYAPMKNLDLGIAYNFQESRANNNAPWFHNHRLELELNPRIPLKNGISLTFRNRYEARWIEALGTTNIDRFRHRSTPGIRRRGLDPFTRDRHFPAHLSQAHEQEHYISDGVRAGRQVTALGRMIS